MMSREVQIVQTNTPKAAQHDEGRTEFRAQIRAALREISWLEEHPQPVKPRVRVS